MRILHPTDFSSTADKAHTLALDLSRRLGADLHVVYVQSRFEAGGPAASRPPLDSVNPEVVRQLEGERQAEVTRLQRRLASLVPPGGSHELRWGEPLPELLALAPAFDLVVMGAHGANRFDSAFLGGTAGRLLRRSPTPVLTVRDEAESRTVGRLLVATDFGPVSRAAWEYSRRLAAGGVRLMLAHIGEPSRGGDDPRETRRITDALDSVAGGEAERLLVRRGNPVTLLPELAAEVGADAIVIGLRRHSSTAGLLLGSRADALLRSSRVPVLGVPAPS